VSPGQIVDKSGGVCATTILKIAALEKATLQNKIIFRRKCFMAEKM